MVTAGDTFDDPLPDDLDELRALLDAWAGDHPYRRAGIHLLDTFGWLARPAVRVCITLADGGGVGIDVPRLGEQATGLYEGGTLRRVYELLTVAEKIEPGEGPPVVTLRRTSDLLWLIDYGHGCDMVVGSEMTARAAIPQGWTVEEPAV